MDENSKFGKGEWVATSIGVLVISWLIFSVYYFDGKHEKKVTDQKQVIPIDYPTINNSFETYNRVDEPTAWVFNDNFSATVVVKPGEDTAIDRKKIVTPCSNPRPANCCVDNTKIICTFNQ